MLRHACSLLVLGHLLFPVSQASAQAARNGGANPITAEIRGQATNRLEPPATHFIPTNVFLTDAGRLFWHKKGERLVETKKLEEAQKSNESRPAEQDPAGHWGPVTEGFQLSLRFDKQGFTNGEPVVATVLLRNVSGKRLTYPRAMVRDYPSPINVSVFKEGKPLPLKTDSASYDVPSVMTITVHPQTQHKYRLRLDKFYDLSGGGLYAAQATFDLHAPYGVQAFHKPGVEQMASQNVGFSITNAPAR